MRLLGICVGLVLFESPGPGSGGEIPPGKTYFAGQRFKGYFIQWHIKLCGLFNAKAILLEEQQWCYLTHSWESKCICPKVNIIARLEFELAHYDSTGQRFNHYTMRTPPLQGRVHRMVPKAPPYGKCKKAKYFF